VIDKMRVAYEARAAMGFPSAYILPAQQRLAMHMLGNAVSPPVARDVINALKEAA
jgi:DNA (cytosine-5)-methyltransferase 1